MHLTAEQKQALKKGETVSVTVEGQEYVLLSRAVFDRVRTLMYDDSEWTHEEMRQLLARSYTGSGWDEPEMDLYDDYDAEQKKRCQ